MKGSYNTADSYSTYKALSKNPVSRSIYIDIINEFFKYIMSLIISGIHVKLPSKCGDIQILGRKVRPRIVDGQIKGLPPDWVKTKKYKDENPGSNKLIFHLNEHTNGVTYKIKWNKALMMTENIKFYSLQFTRTNKRAVHQAVKAGKEYLIKV